jgi:hypothetical protein
VKIRVEHGGPIYAVLAAIGRKAKVDVLPLYQPDPELQIEETIKKLKLMLKMALGLGSR